MLREEDQTPLNEKSHAYHFNITYNGCDFCLLTPSAILALLKYLFKGRRLKFRGFYLPKILFSSLQLKLIGTAQGWAQKRDEAYGLAKLIVHSKNGQVYVYLQISE